MFIIPRERFFEAVFGSAAVSLHGVICRTCRGKCNHLGVVAPVSSPSREVDSRFGHIGCKKRRYVPPPSTDPVSSNLGGAQQSSPVSADRLKT